MRERNKMRNYIIMSTEGKINVLTFKQDVFHKKKHPSFGTSSEGNYGSSRCISVFDIHLTVS